MKPILTYPSWTDLEKGCHVIARKLTLKLYTPSTIVGLIRGGSFLALTLAYIFDIGKENVFHVSYSSENGRGDGGGNLNTMPKISFNDAILIVDDIVDSGSTMKNVVDYYKSTVRNVCSASLYYKRGACIIPDVYWQEISPDSDWIIFPYEI